MDLDAGDTEAAMKRFKNVLNSGTIPAGARTRATQMVLALGGALDEMTDASATDAAMADEVRTEDAVQKSE